jgi:hypothetical protein
VVFTDGLVEGLSLAILAGDTNCLIRSIPVMLEETHDTIVRLD